ncbi:expressed unknown protein [Seminavis robusta]|uniref:Uncharacterized protein n=1 Tax=Seminavis robusta TaxID=568900 RepID=A0A9N8D893_9STRA|nr:expressed unknown protein [Seminavis robusta]|eukprot:Sro34_g021760.1 n/a (745) ;mRNA; f:1850-4084
MSAGDLEYSYSKIASTVESEEEEDEDSQSDEEDEDEDEADLKMMKKKRECEQCLQRAKLRRTEVGAEAGAEADESLPDLMVSFLSEEAEEDSVCSCTATATATGIGYSEQAMALNEAYIALENMRKANLEVALAGSDLAKQVDIHHYCTACLKDCLSSSSGLAKDQCSLAKEQAKGNRRFSFSSPAFVSKVLFVLRHNKNPPPCLVCANPVCKKHSCRKTRYTSKDGLYVCQDCATLFNSESILKQLQLQDDCSDNKDKDNPFSQDQFLVQMIDAYDRALILLQYAAPFVEEIATCLETSTKNTNHIHLSSSSVGMLAGVTGVGAVAGQAAAGVGLTAAATMLTPVGPPLLLASLVLGGTAASATIGTEVYHHANRQSYTQQSANKILAWYQVVTSIQKALNLHDDLHVPTSDDDDDNIHGKLQPEQENDSPLEYPSLDAIDDDSEDDEQSVQDVTPEPKTPDTQATIEPTCTTTSTSASASLEHEHEYALSAIDDDDDDDDEEEEVPTTKYKNHQAANEYEPSTIDIDDNDNAEETADKETTTLPANNIQKTVSTEEYGLSAIDDDSVDARDTGNESIGDEEAKLDENSTEALLLDPVTTNSQTTQTVAVKSNSKHPLACLMPLAPLLDDVLLNISKMFMDPSGGARVAISRASSHAFKVAQIATIACGALSAATIVLEMNNFSKSLHHLKAGSPCQKAQMLRRIAGEVEQNLMPVTQVVAERCEMYRRNDDGDSYDEQELLD